MAPGTSSPRAGSQLHFTYGFGQLASRALANRNGSYGRIERACWPAVMTSGVRFR